MEVARRVIGAKGGDAPLLNRADLVAVHLESVAAGLDVEKFWVLCLNRKNRLRKCVEVSSGTATRRSRASQGGLPGRNPRVRKRRGLCPQPSERGPGPKLGRSADDEAASRRRQDRGNHAPRPCDRGKRQRRSPGKGILQFSGGRYDVRHPYASRTRDIATASKARAPAANAVFPMRTTESETCPTAGTSTNPCQA